MTVVTIVVPTYNRPVELRRLLGFFLRLDGSIPVVVLDSSAPQAQTLNEALCSGLPQVRYQAFEPATIFYEKLQAGIAELVKTPCVCLCADDDLVIPGHLHEAAEAIVSNPSIAVAHGYYAFFKLGAPVRITNLGYSGDISDHTPFRRIARGFLNYEATLYGVHATHLMQRILKEAAGAPNLLAAEVLTTALAQGFGDGLRLKLFSHARSHGASLTAVNWHPGEMLAVDPAALVAAIAYVRDRLIANFSPQAEELKLLDHALLAYVADYVRPAAARRFAQLALVGADVGTLRQAGLDEAAAMVQSTPWMASLRRSRAVKWLRTSMAKNATLRHFVEELLTLRYGRTIERKVEGLQGRTSSVDLEPLFVKRLASVGLKEDHPAVHELARNLAIYSQSSDK